MQKTINKFLEDSSAVGANVIIANKNSIKEQFTYGFQSKEKNIKTSTDTIYRIASISKVIVATTVMTLVDDGIIDIKEDISKYLGYNVRNPYYPEDIISIEMLMTQTSSICDGEDEILGYDGVNGPKFFVSLKRILTDPTYEYYTTKTYLKHKPGSFFCYSNFGCGILACIVECVTGKYFTDYVRERILLPLGLDASFRIEDIKNLDKVASLYTELNNELELIRDKDMFLQTLFPKYELGNNFRGPAGGLFISPVDLTKFMQMLMNYGVYDNKRYLSKETVELMKKVHWQTKHPIGIYKKKGLQLLILDIDGKILYGHTGNAYGLRSFMLFDDNYGYIFMCNGAKYIMATDDFTFLQEECLKEILKYE